MYVFMSLLTRGSSFTLKFETLQCIFAESDMIEFKSNVIKSWSTFWSDKLRVDILYNSTSS